MELRRVLFRSHPKQDVVNFLNQSQSKIGQNKKELQDNSSKISFTTDLWSSNFKDFIGITAHFVDATFVLHHRVICLTQIFSHKGKDVADAFAACLEDWGVIDKIG